MATVQTQVVPAVDAELSLRTPQQRLTNAVSCLVASTDARRRKTLSRGAGRAGWKCVDCASAEAFAEAMRQRFQLALMDIVGPQSQSFREIGKQLARETNTLIVVCGDESQPTDEIWARGLGAWLYLPGLGTIDDLAQLCHEARMVVDKTYAEAIRMFVQNDRSSV
ncbi:MAG: hypothetical protein R3E01_15670 [Pirellulaceae bacterium]|nr:response regulator transcription factor [Planctomycetales bacterium]